MKFSLLILTGLTLAAAGCSHKDDGGRQSQGGGFDQRGGIHDDQGRGRRFGGHAGKKVRIRPHGPSLASLTCLDQDGGQEQILMDQFPDGDSDIRSGSRFSIGGRSVRVMSRNLSGGLGAPVILNVQDLSSGELFQTQCN